MSDPLCDMTLGIGCDKALEGAGGEAVKWRKKPVVVEAFQMTQERRRDNVDWPEWLNEAWNKGPTEVGAVYPRDYPTSDGTDPLVVYTMEGTHLVGWGDYIIQGVKGELYPCKPDIFAETYEPAE